MVNGLEKLRTLCIDFSNLIGQTVEANIYSNDFGFHAHYRSKNWEFYLNVNLYFPGGKSFLLLNHFRVKIDCPIIKIPYFILDETLQGKGYGRKSIERLINVLHEQGIRKFILDAKNESVVSFWEKFGFRRISPLQRDMILEFN